MGLLLKSLWLQKIPAFGCRLSRPLEAASITLGITSTIQYLFWLWAISKRKKVGGRPYLLLVGKLTSFFTVVFGVCVYDIFEFWAELKATTKITKVYWRRCSNLSQLHACQCSTNLSMFMSTGPPGKRPLGKKDFETKSYKMTKGRGANMDRHGYCSLYIIIYIISFKA